MRLRRMELTDCPEVAALSEHLGYPTDTARVKQRFKVILNDVNHGVFVVQSGNAEVIGWVHIYGVHLLESDGYAEIGGLVVHPEARRQGAGCALMKTAEQWAKEHGHRQVRLLSGQHRAPARLFYERIGYALTKTSLMFCKILNS